MNEKMRIAGYVHSVLFLHENVVWKIAVMVMPGVCR